MAKPYRLPLHIRLIRASMRPVFRLIFYLLSRVKITGLSNVPRSGGYLVAINHISLYEAPLITAFWPVAPEVAGATEIWQRPGQATLARLYGGIQVHRGQFDRQVIDIILAALHSGRPLIIAPEGGRSHQPGMRRAFPGVAYIMDKARVPVLPVGFVGTTDDFMSRALRGERPLLEMRIGPPFRLPPIDARGADRRRLLQFNADQVMLQIARLLPFEYHGIYAEPSHLTYEADERQQLAIPPPA